MKLSSHGNGKLQRKTKLSFFLFSFSINEKFTVLLALKLKYSCKRKPQAYRQSPPTWQKSFVMTKPVVIFVLLLL